MAQSICPSYANDENKLKSLDKSCSKYLEASPIRIKLLPGVLSSDLLIGKRGEYKTCENFWMKKAVAECLETPEAIASEKSLDVCSLRRMLMQRYPDQIE